MNEPLPPKSASKVSKPSLDNGTSPEAPSAKSPSVKQRHYVKGRIAGKSKKQAALEAGYAKSTAENTKQKIDKKPEVQKLFEELLEEAGVSNPLLARRIYQGLHAMETKLYANKGIVLDRRNLVSFAERREMLELALKVKGLLVDKHEIDHHVTLEDLLDESHKNDGCDPQPKP
jgi:hypothetical protein